MKNKYKLIKIISVNLIIIFVLLILTEFLLNLNQFIGCLRFIPQEEKKHYDYVGAYLNKVRNDYNKTKFYDKEFRPFPNNEEDLPSILVFGCSYAYGTNLKDNETISAKLSEATGLPVYNLGIQGGGIREILHMLQNDKLYKYLGENHFNKNKVKYVIYLYQGDHQKRIFTSLRRPLVPNYKEKGNELVFQPIKNRFWEMCVINKTVQEMYFSKYLYKIHPDKCFERLALYVNEIDRIIHDRLKNGDEQTKLIVLDYHDWGNEDWSKVNSDIEVIKIKELAKIDIGELPYIVMEGDDHPSALVWELTMPILASRLN